MTELGQNPDRPEENAAAPAEEPEIVAAPPPKRIRVAWVAGAQTPSDLGRTLQPLAIGLMDEMVELLTLCPQEADTRDLPSPPLEIVRYSRDPWWIFRQSPLEFLSDQIRRRPVQVLHALEPPAADLTRRLARTLNLPYVVSTYALGTSGWLTRAEQHAWAVLCGSDIIRQDLIDQRTVHPEQARVIRPGVYQVRHATCFTDPQLRPVIVAGGRLDDCIALDALVRSFAEIRRRKHDCVFFIMGNGRAERLIRAHADKLALTHDLTFVDWQPPSQLSGIFKAADIYVSPTTSRQLDMYSLLAMAAGVPVVAACRGASDFILEGKTALMFTPGDSEELTARLMFLLDNREAASALAEKALDHLRTRHSPAGMVTAMAEVYRQAATAVAFRPSQPATARA